MSNTHTRLTALFPGVPRSAGTRKVKPIWILLEQETVSGNGISWAICKSAPCSRQITTPVPNHSSFLQAGCPSCRPTNSVKALKATWVTVLQKSGKCQCHWSYASSASRPMASKHCRVSSYFGLYNICLWKGMSLDGLWLDDREKKVT